MQDSEQRSAGSEQGSAGSEQGSAGSEQGSAGSEQGSVRFVGILFDETKRHKSTRTKEEF